MFISSHTWRREEVCQHRLGRDMISFKYGENDVQFQTVCPERKLEREVQTLAPLSHPHSWLITMCFKKVIEMVRQGHFQIWWWTGRSCPKLFNNLTRSSDEAYGQRRHCVWNYMYIMRNKMYSFCLFRQIYFLNCPHVYCTTYYLSYSYF